MENIEGTKEKTNRIVEELLRVQDTLGDSLGQVGRVEDGDRMEAEGEVEIGAREPGGQVAREARMGKLAGGWRG